MRLSAAIASLAAALMLTGAAAGATTFGVTDDAGKYADDGGAAFFSTLTDLGMTENRVSVLWDPANPTTIADQTFLDRSVPQAAAHGIDLVLDIYPAKARALQEAAMAACYDALKAVNPNIDVIGFGFSPRGNDSPSAANNVSHSPIRLLKEIGDAYRASGRALPIADDVSVHCYPNVNTDAPTDGYLWPNVGCANLDRFKQAWWDAFHGTAQPLFQEPGAAGTFARFFLDEVG